jgi:hypothetical protein
MPVTFDAVREFALSLPDVEEGTSYGTPAFRAGGKFFVRLREDGDSLVVPTGFEERAELLAEDPDTYYITGHYLNYPYVLVRLSRVNMDALRDLLRGAHRSAAVEKQRRPARRPSARPPRRRSS